MTDLKTACVELVEALAKEPCEYYSALRDKCLSFDNSPAFQCGPCRARLVLQQAKEDLCSTTS